MNTTTPRLFIAATEQNTGKTTTALGLHAALKSQFPRIGFIKPVGQRFVDVEGKLVDEDSVLIRSTFDTQSPLEAMSPIAVEPDFTRRYIDSANHDVLIRRIQHSFDRAAWEKDFVLIEGTGHAGVGSVFDLSNAHVARILNAKVLLIVPGGIGRPIDEAVLNKALFDREGVEVIGVVMNKLLPSKLDRISSIARKGLERLGIRLYGVMPHDDVLPRPTLRQVCNHIHADFIHGTEMERNLVADVLIGAMSAAHLYDGTEESTLLVVPGDRDDLILGAVAKAAADVSPFCGMVFSDGLIPAKLVLDLACQSPLPVMTSRLDSYTISSRIHSMTVKTLPGDREKISRIEQLIAERVDTAAILERLGIPDPS